KSNNTGSLVVIKIWPSQQQPQAPWDFSGPGECPEYTKDSKINERVLILPVGGVEENKTGFGFLYFFLIAYFFLGIFVASDIFMRSIEIIVSKTKTVKSSHIEDGIKINEKRQVKVWNETIANLTLMALGSSAPEILLSIIETAGNRFCTGALGPGTIVGSASYNLFIITAVCIVSVPNEGTRRIQEYKVFLTTSLFAMVAYIWMVVMIQSISKGEVHIWEAVLTLCMFPVMIGVAYWAELDFCIKGRSQRRSSVATTIHDPSIAPLADAEAAEPLFHFCKNL
ncbi:Sodium/calcium exchanger 2, partial [Orchesella cincta]